MRLAITIALGLFVLTGVAYLALHIESSIAKDEYVRVEAPQVTLSEDSEDGIRSFRGEVMVPTRCTPVTASALLSDGGVRIDVTFGEDEDICLALPEAKEFLVEIEAPEDALVGAFVNQAKATVVDSL